MLTFKILGDAPRDLYLPPVYAAVLGDLPAGPAPDEEACTFPRRTCPGRPPRISMCACSRRSGCCGSWPAVRAGISGTVLPRELALAASKGVVVFQVMVNLGEPCRAGSWRGFGSRAFSSAGSCPQWFGADGLLMQKLAFRPDCDAIKLQSPRAHELLAFLRREHGTGGPDLTGPGVEGSRPSPGSSHRDLRPFVAGAK